MEKQAGDCKPSCSVPGRQEPPRRGSPSLPSSPHSENQRKDWNGGGPWGRSPGGSAWQSGEENGGGRAREGEGGQQPEEKKQEQERSRRASTSPGRPQRLQPTAFVRFMITVASPFGLGEAAET